MSFTVDKTTIPSNHNGNITLTLTGSGTAWINGTTVFTVSGVSGIAVVSNNVTSTTAATVVISLPAILPASSNTGTLVVGDGLTTTNVTVGTPSISIDGLTNYADFSRSPLVTGVNTIWSGETASTLFTVTGSSTGYNTVGPIVASNTSARVGIYFGPTAGTITLKDNSTGATATITVSSYTVPVITSTYDFSTLPGAVAGYRMDSTLYKDTAKTQVATTNGDLVAVVPNMVAATGSTFDLVQATSGSRPVFQNSTLGGKPGVVCNSSKVMATAGTMLDASFSGAFTVYCVSNADSGTSRSFDYIFALGSGSSFAWSRAVPAAISNALSDYNGPPTGAGAYGTCTTSLTFVGLSSTTTSITDDNYAAVQCLKLDAGPYLTSSNLRTRYPFGTLPTNASPTPGTLFAKTGALSGTGVLTMSQGNSSTCFNGSIQEIWIFNQGHTDAVRRQVEAALVAKYAVPLKNQVIFEGDSITVNPSLANGYPTIATTALDTGAWYNILTGTSGYTIQHMLNYGRVRAFPHNPTGRVRTIIDLEGGTNDIATSVVANTSAGGDDLYDNYYKPLCRIYAALGQRVTTHTILPRDAQKAPRQQFNARLRADWMNIADAISDPAADTVIGDNNAAIDSNNNNHNATYYQGDFIHPTTAGSTILSDYSRSAIKGVAIGAAITGGGFITQPGIDNGLIAGALIGPLTVTTTSNALMFSAATGGTGPYTAQLQRAPNVVYSDGGNPAVNYDCPGTFADVSGVNTTTNGATLTDTTTLTAATKYWWRVKVTDSTGTPIVNYSNLVSGTVATAGRVKRIGVQGGFQALQGGIAN